MNTRLRNLKQRAAALLPAPPWTFERFRAEWAGMDELSLSLYQTMAATPGAVLAVVTLADGPTTATVPGIKNEC